MLVCRRLLIAAAIAASVEASAVSASFSDIAGPEYTAAGYAVYSGATPIGGSSGNILTGSTSTTASSSASGCRPSEFPCTNGRCVAQDKYCDGEDDCRDKTDEPRYCSRKTNFNFYSFRNSTANIPSFYSNDQFQRNKKWKIFAN